MSGGRRVRGGIGICLFLAASFAAGAFAQADVNGEDERLRAIREQSREWLHQQIRERLAEQPFVPDYLTFEVGREDVERLCDQLDLGDDARTVAEAFFETHRARRVEANAALVALTAEWDTGPLLIGVTEPVEVPERELAKFRESRLAAVAEHRADIQMLFNEVSGLAAGASPATLAHAARAWDIGIYLNRTNINEPTHDLDRWVNLLEVFDELSESEQRFQAFFNRPDVQELLDDYHLRLWQIALRRADMFGPMMHARAAARDDDDDADRWLRMHASLWRSFDSLTSTTSTAIESIIASDLSNDDAIVVRRAVGAALFTSTDRVDAAERVHDWMVDRYDLRNGDSELATTLDEVIAGHRDSRRQFQPRLRQIARELQALGNRGMSPERMRLLQERSELHARHRALMDATIERIGAIVPEQDQSAFTRACDEIVADDARFCHNQIFGTQPLPDTRPN